MNHELCPNNLIIRLLPLEKSAKNLYKKINFPFHNFLKGQLTHIKKGTMTNCKLLNRISSYETLSKRERGYTYTIIDQFSTKYFFLRLLFLFLRLFTINKRLHVQELGRCVCKKKFFYRLDFFSNKKKNKIFMIFSCLSLFE